MFPVVTPFVDQLESTPEEDAETSSRPPIKRISKACDNCRERRIKCEPPFPCKACRLNARSDCHVRPKARPGRLPRQGESTKNIKNTEQSARIAGLRRLRMELESIYEELTGVPIDLSLGVYYSHPLLDLSTPMPEAPQLTASASNALQAFITYCLPFCTFLSPSRISHLFDRYVASPNSLQPDQSALVCIALACGYVRLQYFEETTGAARFVAPSERQDVAWYRRAVDLLDKWGSATFTSLHALSCTRSVVSWMISQARELGIHNEQTAAAVQHSPTDRADLMFFIVLYAHYYYTCLSEHPPTIKPGEFDTILFAAFQAPHETEYAVAPRRDVLELTLLNTQLLLNLHEKTTRYLSIEWLLRVEDRWKQWLKLWIKQGRTTGHSATDPLVGVLWDWGRIMLRAAVHDDERFSMSSYAIIARSSAQIISRYHRLYERQIYNLVWQHFQHIVTSAHLVLLCFWQFELTKEEAEDSLSKAISLIKLSVPKWTTCASEAREKIETIAAAFGLIIPTIESSSGPSISMPTEWFTGDSTSNQVQSGFLFTDVTNGQLCPTGLMGYLWQPI